MRITKLHLLVLFVLVAAGALGFYFLKVKRAEMQEREERKKAELAMQQKAQELAAKQKLAERQAPMEPPTTAPTPEPEKKELGAMTYTVETGDTLWSIAKKREHFGLGHRWYDVWKANEESIEDFDKIVAGQLLTIPLDKGDGYPWPKTSKERKEKILSQGHFRTTLTSVIQQEIQPEEQAVIEEEPIAEEELAVDEGEELFEEEEAIFEEE